MGSSVVLFKNFRNQITYPKTCLNKKFNQDQTNWKQKINTIDISKTESDKVVGLYLYRNRYALIRKLQYF